MREVLWVLDHLRDVKADLRVLARVSWPEALAWPGPELLALIYRLPLYGGALAARVSRQTPAPAVTSYAYNEEVREVPATQEALKSSVFGRYASFGKG